MDKRTIINGVIAILLLILAVVGYQFFIAGNQKGLVQTGALAQGAPSGQSTNDFLAAVAGLRNLNLDTTLFQNPAFTRLFDFGVALTPEPVRNSNPFLPFGRTATPIVDEDEE